VLGLLAAAMAGLTVPPALEPVTAVVGGVSGGVPERHDLPAADVHATELRVHGARAIGGGRLVIPAEQLAPGNAATYYLAAVAELRNATGRDFDAEKLAALLAAPLDSLKPEEVRSLGLRSEAEATSWLKDALHRPHVEWPRSLPAESGTLFDVSGHRFLLTRLMLDVRWDLHEGHLAAAEEKLRWAYVAAGALAKSDQLIVKIAAASEVKMLNARARELLEQPGASNLYWSLAELPSWSAGMTAAARNDIAYVYVQAPELERLRTGAFSQADWDRFVARLADPNGLLGPDAGPFMITERTDAERKAIVAKALAEALPQAKAYATGQGRAGVSDDELLATYLVRSFDQWNEEALKWTTVPFAEAHQHLQSAEKARQASADHEVNFLLALNSSVDRACAMVAAADRGVAMLRVVESVRDYAGRHDGQVPPALAAITDLPVPADPMTGTAFGYRLEGEVARISAPAPEGLDNRFAEAWTVRIRK
jgi:hypothetical protein